MCFKLIKFVNFQLVNPNGDFQRFQENSVSYDNESNSEDG